MRNWSDMKFIIHTCNILYDDFVYSAPAGTLPTVKIRTVTLRITILLQIQGYQTPSPHVNRVRSGHKTTASACWKAGQGTRLLFREEKRTGTDSLRIGHFCLQNFLL